MTTHSHCVGGESNSDLIVIAFGKYEAHPGENMRAAAQLDYQMGGFQIRVRFKLPVLRDPC
jgi:hypothetical protein